MFDTVVPDAADLADISDAALIDAIAGWSSSAAQAEARKFTALAEWHRRHCADPERPQWACDDTDNAAAQVACALTVSHGRALGLMDTAVALRDRLPRLGRRFLAGAVSERVVARIVWLSALVVDDHVLDRLDRELAAAAANWGVLSGDKLDAAIEALIHTHDPDAIRRVRARVRGRDFVVGKREDSTGTTSVYGRVHTVDAALAVERMAVMIRSVCAADPRTMAQRRADAFGAVFAGVFVLACRCGNPDCPATAVQDARAASVVVHVIADNAALDVATRPVPRRRGTNPRTREATRARSRDDGGTAARGGDPRSSGGDPARAAAGRADCPRREDPVRRRTRHDQRRRRISTLGRVGRVRPRP